jgi:hypothetical protein
MWLSNFLLARNLASPRLGHEPKAKVVTNNKILLIWQKLTPPLTTFWLKYAIQFAILKFDSLLSIKLIIIVHFVYHIVSFLTVIMFKIIIKIEMWFLGSNLCDS